MVGVIKHVKDFAPKCVSTHCFLHRESLATKKLSSMINNVLCEVVKIVNHIKGSPLNYDYSCYYAMICKQITCNFYFILACSGCQEEKSCQEYINSEMSWQCFCIIKSQNGLSCSKMNIGLPCLLT